MKKILLFFFLFITFVPLSSQARPTMAISGFGGGNFPLTHTFPELDVGAGGGIAYDYRFNQHWALSTSAAVFSHDGKGASSGDRDIFLLNIPNVDLKFYLLKNELKFDPYLHAGLGLYVLTGGNRSDNSGGAGLGAQVGIGSDFYLSPWMSLGAAAQFKSVGLIRGNSQSSALLFLTLLGSVTFHFR